MSVEEDRLEIFREEASLYGRIRDKLLMEHRGEWVALRKGALLASSNDLSTLLKEVFERLGDEPLYVTKVGEEEEGWTKSLQASTTSRGCGRRRR